MPIRRTRRCEKIDLIDARLLELEPLDTVLVLGKIKRRRDIMPNKFKMLIRQQRVDITLIAG